MDGTTGRRTAKLRTELTIPVIEALEPAAKPWIAWDDKVIGFGVRLQPSGAKSFIVNFRMGKGGPLKRMVIERVGEMLPGQARQRARAIIERTARGEDPEKARDTVLAVPTLEEVFEAYMTADEGRAPRTVQTYRYEMKRYLGDWLSRPLDSIDAEDIRGRFERITDNHGWSGANRVFRYCVRSTGNPAPTSRPCTTPSASGSPKAAASTPSRGGKSQLRPTCCHAGGPASRPKSTTW